MVGFPIGGRCNFTEVCHYHLDALAAYTVLVRISQAIWYIITRLLHCVCAHYFDDFPVVEVSSGCRVLSSAVSAVLDMLGWTHAKEGDKIFPFAAEFEVFV